MPSEPRQITPATVKTASSSQSFGQPRWKNSLPASTTIAIWIAAFVSALNVVAMIDMPAMPGTMTSRFSWSPEKIAPNSARKSRGRPKLKNAAVGLRQNIRRSRRYWCQVRTSSDTHGLPRRLGRELEVDVLQRGTRDRQLAHGPAARQGGGRQVV